MASSSSSSSSLLGSCSSKQAKRAQDTSSDHGIATKTLSSLQTPNATPQNNNDSNNDDQEEEEEEEHPSHHSHSHSDYTQSEYFLYTSKAAQQGDPLSTSTLASLHESLSTDANVPRTAQTTHGLRAVSLYKTSAALYATLASFGGCSGAAGALVAASRIQWARKDARLDALACLVEAAESEPELFRVVGDILYAGVEGVLADPGRAKEMFQLGVERGSLGACKRLAEVLLAERVAGTMGGRRVDGGLVGVVGLLERVYGNGKGDLSVCSLLGDLYLAIGEEYGEIPAGSGDDDVVVVAVGEMGEMIGAAHDFLEAEVPDKDKKRFAEKKAFEVYEMGWSVGKDVGACHRLVYCLQNGIGCEADLDRVCKLNAVILGELWAFLIWFNLI
jgi:hypothetical protein